MSIASNESWQNHMVRKKVKKINMLATDVGDIIWQPAPGRQYVLTHAFIKVRGATGALATPPSFKITNGTGDTVATVAGPTVVGVVNRLAVIGNIVFDYDNPLTLVISVAGATGTVLNEDLILFAMKISE